MGHRPFLVLADYLTSRGIAVLRVDDRGVGGSTGSTMQATLEDNVSDVLTGIAFLRNRPEIDGRRTGLIGHSEGGWIAPIAATQSSDVAFIVLLAGPGVSGEELLYAQQAALLRAGGQTEAYIAGNDHLSRVVFEVIRQTDDKAEAKQLIDQGIERLRAGLSEAERAAVDAVRAGIPETQRDAQLATMLTPWFRYLLDYDPALVLRKVSVPVLALIGELDLQVPHDQNIPALETAFSEGATDDYMVLELPGLNHLFQTAETGAISEYAQIEETFAPAALEGVGGWILERMGQGRSR